MRWALSKKSERVQTMYWYNSLEMILVKFSKDLKSGYPFIIPLLRLYPKGVIQDAFKD